MTFSPFFLWLMLFSFAAFSIRAIIQNRDYKTEKPYYIKGLNMFLVLKGIFICLAVLLLIILDDFRYFFGGIIPFFLIRMIESVVYGMEAKNNTK